MLYTVLYAALLTSVVLSFRVASSCLIALIILIALVTLKKNEFRKIDTSVLLFTGGLFLFYIIQFISISWSQNSIVAWSTIRIQSGILAVIIMLFLTMQHISVLQVNLLTNILTATAAACIGNGVYLLIATGNSEFLFYHSLVSLFNQHAVYISVLGCLTLIFLIENKQQFPRSWRSFFIVVLSIFLFLLSSKLVILIYCAYLVYRIVFQSRQVFIQRKYIVPCCAGVCIAAAFLISSPNAIKDRFIDLTRGNTQVMTQQNFAPQDYFNGFQFRLLQWRFTGEILNEKDAWLTGIGTGDVQDALNSTYTKHNLYTGYDGKSGYKLYNSHNQFLQTLLGTGVPGLAALMIAAAGLFLMMKGIRSTGYRFSLLLLILWLFTESVFETQYGVFIFTFFPIWLYKLYHDLQSKKPAA